jgi:hypothetical protein
MIYFMVQEEAEANGQKSNKQFAEIILKQEEFETQNPDIILKVPAN